MTKITTATPSRLVVTIGLCFMVALMEGLDLQAAGIAAVGMAQAFALDKMQMGWIFSAGILGLLPGALVGGMLADRHGRKRILLGSVLLFGLFSLATALAWSFPTLLLARLLNLNEVQSGVLNIIFRIADDRGLLLLDFKDLRAITQFIGDNAKSFQNQYGNINSASIGAIQRGLLTLVQQGAEHFFGEPMLDIADWMRVDASGKGVINILSAEKLYQMPKLYAASLLWMLSELYERLPEAGDLDKPKLVFFFDEAHLLFNDAPQVLLDKIEQVIRLIRSNGVGVYFVSQNPADIPDAVLGQLGNRVQHALRAFTPKDQKAVKTAAQTMRANPAFSTEQAIQELGTGEALISFLDEKGSPSVVERAMVIAPCSRMGPVSDDERNGLLNHSPLYGKYEEEVDRESAFEMLQQGVQVATGQQSAPPAKGQQNGDDDGLLGGLKDILFGSTGPRGGKRDGIVQTAAKSAVRQVTNQIVRGMLGSLLGGRKR